MDITDHQRDMRDAFGGGGPGVVASGLVWSAAGIVAALATFRLSIIVFFFAGMAIQPLAILGSKAIRRRGAAAKGNPFTALALESTVMLFAGLVIAYATARSNPGAFYPIMLLVIGARYFTFATIYGNRLFWVLGGVLALIGGATIAVVAVAPSVAAIAGGAVEIVFGLALLMRDRTRAASHGSDG
jgi:hypothetical protein